MKTRLGKANNPSKLFLLDRAKKRPSSFESLRPRIISTQAELWASVPCATRDSLWISYASDLTEALLKYVSSLQPSLGLGVFIHSIDIKTMPALTSCFRRVAFTIDGGFLPPEELAEVFSSEIKSDLFIGGIADNATETITFWKGDLKPLTVPFSTFEPSGTGTKPDFGKLAFVDSGHTIRLGEYEAAVDAILYEYDPTYRRRISKMRLEKDQSFGAALRRLRKQRGLRREDFEPDVSAKTIARIEQGKVTRIQKRTLNTLAKRLKVQPDEIQTF